MFELFVANDSTDDEATQTIPHLVALKPRHKIVTAFSNARTRATRWFFSHQADRDHAKEWLLRWACERGLRHGGII